MRYLAWLLVGLGELLLFWASWNLFLAPELHRDPLTVFNILGVLSTFLFIVVVVVIVKEDIQWQQH